MQNSLVDGDEGLVLPEGSGGGSVEPQCLSDALEQIVPLGVTEVAGGNFGAHVPPIEGSTGISNAANDQRHFTDHGNGIPAQSQRVYGGVLGVGDVHFREKVGMY